MEAKERIICAIDVETEELALERVAQLKDHIGVFKAGLELVTATGTSIFPKMREAGAERIFYDAKLHDIPNTVGGAMKSVVRLGAWCVTVHATGGSAMLQAAVKAAQSVAEAEDRTRPRVLAVTVLTSIKIGRAHV